LEDVQDDTIHGSADPQTSHMNEEEPLNEEDAHFEGKSLHSMTEANKPSYNMPPAHQSSAWTPNAEPVPPGDRLANFYRKYNNVLMDTVAIEKEKDRLSLENAQLQDLIEQFISGTNLDEKVLLESNPLFVVNGRANLNHVPPVRQVKPTIQSGNQITNSVIKQFTS
jgi:hypothetical protein